MTQSQLAETIRLIKIKGFIKRPQVFSKLSNEEKQSASSRHFPMTVLERFLSISEAREKWGIEYDGINVKIISNRESFYHAFAKLIQQIINKDITTRFTKDDLPDILQNLPSVSFNGSEKKSAISAEQNDTHQKQSKQGQLQKTQNSTPINNVGGNPNRKNLIPFNCELNTDNYKLEALFKELKQLPFKYQYSISVVLRVFFDLAISQYIESEAVGDAIKKHYQKELKSVTLKQKLEYFKTSKNLSLEHKKIIKRLLNSENDNYSLDTLNKYIHSAETCYSSKNFLNSFWDFLYPLIKKLLDIKETQ